MFSVPTFWLVHKNMHKTFGKIIISEFNKAFKLPK